MTKIVIVGLGSLSSLVGLLLILHSHYIESNIMKEAKIGRSPGVVYDPKEQNNNIIRSKSAEKQFKLGMALAVIGVTLNFLAALL